MSTFRDYPYSNLRSLRDYPRRTSRRSRKGSKEESTKVRIGTRVVGKIRNDEFIKRVRGSVHFLHTPRAIAFDIDTLQQADQLGAKWVRVVDIETGKIFRAPISLIFDKGFRFNRGFGDQIGLEMQYWSQGDSPMGEQMQMWRQP